jgi:hypothetical protein
MKFKRIITFSVFFAVTLSNQVLSNEIVGREKGYIAYKSLDADGKVKIVKTENIFQTKTELNSAGIAGTIPVISMDVISRNGDGSPGVYYGDTGPFYSMLTKAHYDCARMMRKVYERSYHSTLNPYSGGNIITVTSGFEWTAYNYFKDYPIEFKIACDGMR